MRKTALLIAILLCLSAYADKQKEVTIDMLTSKGRIVIKLYNQTPLHRDNFIKLVNEGYLKDLLFHRVIQDFMIQGGDPDSRNADANQRLGEGGPDYTLPAEISFPTLFHKRGALAAAREGDLTNPQRRSSGSQFYIVWGRTFSREEIDKLASAMQQASQGSIVMPDNIKKYYMRYGGTPHLDGTYTVFGEVVKGLEVVNAIQQVATDNNDRPLEDVKILSVEVRK